MSLYDRVKTDNQKILNKGFSIVHHITNGKSGEELKDQDIKGFYVDTSLEIDPDNGLPIVGQKIAVTFNIDDITIGSGVNENYEKWKAIFTNHVGKERIGYFQNPIPDRTIGMITATLSIEE